MRPSAIAGVGGADPSQQLDFDLGVLWFTQWVESKRDEVVWVKQTDEHKGMMAKPRYKSLDDIWALYDETVGMTKFAPQAPVSEAYMAEIAELAFADDVLF